MSGVIEVGTKGLVSTVKTPMAAFVVETPGGLSAPVRIPTRKIFEESAVVSGTGEGGAAQRLQVSAAARAAV
ncbi:hypothetical protein [Streptomyces sp. NPDC096339]|uniref:hypothetical protein n=1 Tax=Streptomyces sp. NPDC096339 TaxID=3366086 RepID=UPI00382BD572